MTVVGLGAWCDYEDEHRDDGGLSFRVRELAAQPDSLFELDEGLTMIIGANRTAILFEVGVVHGGAAPVIIHAMRAREKFLR